MQPVKRGFYRNQATDEAETARARERTAASKTAVKESRLRSGSPRRRTRPRAAMVRTTERSFREGGTEDE